MDKRILVVDDSRTMRDMLALTLTSFGYTVVKAEDGVDGLSIAKSDSFDLVISDINMPNMDGYEMIKCIRNEKQYQYTPILVLSTESNTTMKQKGKEAGATGWIVKPFSPEKLKTKLKMLISLK